MKRALIASLFVLFAVNIFAELEVKGSPEELKGYLNGIQTKRTVTLSAQSEIKVDADQAIVLLAVTTDNDLLSEALKSNQTIRAKLVKTLNDAGIGSERIKISQFSSTPDYGWFKKKPKSYKIENKVKVTIENETEFQKVAQIVDKYSEIEFRGTEFEKTEKPKLKRQVTEKALNAVMEKKKMYEQQLGLKLTPVNFNQGMVNVDAPEDEHYGRNIERSYRFSNVAQVMMVAEVGSETTSFGEMIFYGNVSVEFKVEQTK